MRILLRFISLLMLAGAVIAGIIDSIQSVAGEKIVMSSTQTALDMFRPGMAEMLQNYVRIHISLQVVANAFLRLFEQPAFIVLLSLSLAFYLLAYRRSDPRAGMRIHRRPV